MSRTISFLESAYWLHPTFFAMKRLYSKPGPRGPRNKTVAKRPRIKTPTAIMTLGPRINGVAANARDEARRARCLQYETERRSRRRFHYACSPRNSSSAFVPPVKRSEANLPSRPLPQPRKLAEGDRGMPAAHRLRNGTQGGPPALAPGI